LVKRSFLCINGSKRRVSPQANAYPPYDPEPLLNKLVGMLRPVRTRRLYKYGASFSLKRNH
jgi:hypothetical protein